MKTNTAINESVIDLVVLMDGNTFRCPMSESGAKQAVLDIEKAMLSGEERVEVVTSDTQAILFCSKIIGFHTEPVRRSENAHVVYALQDIKKCLSQIADTVKLIERKKW